MDYKEQIEQAKHAAEKWREKHRIVGVGEFRVDCMVDDLTRSITALLARTEAAEEEVSAMRKELWGEKTQRKFAELAWQVSSEHSIMWEGRAQEGKCRAEAAEARARELETRFRTEKCENGPECVELGRVRKALAEARAEKAERERDAAVADLRLVSDCRTCGNVTTWCIDNPDKCKGYKWRGQKEE